MTYGDGSIYYLHSITFAWVQRSRVCLAQPEPAVSIDLLSLSFFFLSFLFCLCYFILFVSILPLERCWLRILLQDGFKSQTHEKEGYLMTLWSGSPSFHVNRALVSEFLSLLVWLLYTDRIVVFSRITTCMYLILIFFSFIGSDWFSILCY